MYSIGVDIGGSHITSSMFEHLNKMLLKESSFTYPVDNSAPKSEILSQWCGAILRTIETAGIDTLEGVGVAVPGPFDYYEGISKIQGVEKFESLYLVNVRNELSERLSLRPDQIRFINDAVSFSIGEARFGEAAAYDRCVAITLGTGLGSCFLDKGRPVIMAENVPDQGVLYNKYYEGSMADDLFSTRGLIKAYAKRTRVEVGGAYDIFLAAKSDERAVETLQQFGSDLGCFLKPHLDLFDAEVLVLGGNISGAYDYFGDHLQRELPGVKICVSTLNERAAIIGAASLFEPGYYGELQDTLKQML